MGRYSITLNAWFGLFVFRFFFFGRVGVLSYERERERESPFKKVFHKALTQVRGLKLNSWMWNHMLTGSLSLCRLID